MSAQQPTLLVLCYAVLPRGEKILNLAVFALFSHLYNTTRKKAQKKAKSTFKKNGLFP